MLKGIKDYFRQASQWFYDTPERSLDRAYKAALMIKAMEDEHFGGRKIPTQSQKYGDNAIAYFQSELRKYLKIAKVGLAEFKASRSFSNKNSKSFEDKDQIYSFESRENNGVILDKLNFIDAVICQYSRKKAPPQSYSLIPVDKTDEKELTEVGESNVNPSPYEGASAKNAVPQVETISDKTGILPRSILRTFQRLQRDLDPKAENEVVKNFRISQTKTAVSIRFILLLILIPLLTQQVSKHFIVGPIIDQLRHETSEVFLNYDMEREAFIELDRFERELRFKSLIGRIPQLTQTEVEEQLQEKAIELEDEFRRHSANAIKNVFADGLSLLSFCFLIFNSKKEITVLKSFLDDVVYGLSDSAKAFIIILFTDIFVGYHSPHGWEVILQGIAHHLGLPENRQFDFVFIATFPVILDTLLKYWIFRYLNRISPSAVATYRNMNE